MKNLGAVRITKEFLEKFLPLPDGTKIIQTQQNNSWDEFMTFYIEHEDIPQRKEGEVCPKVQVEVTEDSKGYISSKFII